MILWPTPQSMQARPGALALLSGQYIMVQGPVATLLPIAERLRDALERWRGVRWELSAGTMSDDPRCGAVIVVDARFEIPAQGYRLSITPERIELRAADAAGAFYAVVTLEQILGQSDGALSACEINDHPDFPTRGLLVDVSRDKVPTLATLFALVDQLAALKVNHLELYFETAFAYRQHPEVWGYRSPVPGRIHLGMVAGTPVTGEDILQLDAYCRARFIELVPNQNSFGHLAPWLDLPRYKHLAECPDGFDWPWEGGGRADFPFSLDPTNPQSLAFLAGLYDELLPHFTSRKFNVGCDETHDLGLGRSAAECRRKGKGRVYLEFLLKVHQLVSERGRVMHFWSDALGHYPELLAEIPRDAVILEWGYSADHSFDGVGARNAAANASFYVCPSVSAFGSIAGRHERCLKNIRAAAVQGHRHGAIGLLNTDWGDGGHLNYQPISYLGIAAGAALAWCNASYREEQLPAALDRHVFADAAGVTGKVAHALGHVYLHFGKDAAFARLLWHDRAQPLPEGVTEESLLAAREAVQAAIAPLADARLSRPDGTLIRAEFENTARMMLHACDRSLALRRGTLDDASTREHLATSLRIIVAEHRRLWLSRNRTSGLQDACFGLDEQLRELSGSQPKA